jgi:transcriptional regulator with PAS, ATPase and Fis domain
MLSDDDSASTPTPVGPTVELAASNDPTIALLPRFALLVLEGPDAGRRCASAGQKTVIGTHDSADFVLRDRTVSRFHCEISQSEGVRVLRDLRSRNGTWLDGVAVIEALPRPGSILSIGATKLRFDPTSDLTPIPLSTANQFGRMLGTSVAMRAAFAQLERAAASDSTVLLEGETGTGKELAAEAIHRASARAKGPFFVFDCSAVPQSLMESELFGHEAGAFTGASQTRRGAFEEANGGTIFFDELGELGLELQPKLLRALQTREVKRVGGSAAIPVDVRIIAATNRNLRAEVNRRRFRPDLYYRLAVLQIRLPPLRERLDDLQPLVAHMLHKIGATPADHARICNPDQEKQLRRHLWPGNLRELRNFVERSLAVPDATWPPATADPLPATPTVDLDTPLARAREDWLQAFEHQYLAGLLQRHGDNVSAAARAAQMSRIHFHRLLKRHGLR